MQTEDSKEKKSVTQTQKETPKETTQISETKAVKTIQFDQTHIPKYKTKAEFEKDYRPEKETALQMAKVLQKQEVQENRENAYRISLVKGEKEDLTAVLLKRREEWEKEARNGKEVPEIVISSPFLETYGEPIPVNEFLEGMGKETLAEATKGSDGKTYVIDSVYDRMQGNELRFHSSRVQEDNNKEEPRFFSVKDNALIPMCEKYEELEAVLKEANEELIDKDKYEFSDAGIAFDTSMIGDAQNAQAVKSGRIQEAGAAEQERLEWGRDTRNKGPAVLDAVRDDDVSAPPPKPVYRSEFYNMEQDVSKLSGELEAMEQEIREEVQSKEEEEEQDRPEAHMSYRERIEAEDRDYWEADLVREY